LHTIDLQSENPWENKGVFMLYGDLVLGFIRVILYFVFMSLMIKIHTFPLFAIRPMYLSLRSFKKTFNDVVMSRRAIRNLNNMYPDVTPEQLANYSDTICIICREEMSSAPGDTSQQIKKLPCDHIFHKNCLRSWFQRQQTCPTCRTTVLRLNQAHLNNQLPNQPPQTPPPQQQQAQGAPSQPQTPFANQQAGGTSSANIHSSPNRTLSSSATFLISPDQPQAQNIFNSNNRFLTNPLSVPGFLAPPLPPFGE
jgi:E3 ubiquitin-protein ligase synoviolin